MSADSKYQEQNDVQERPRFFDGQFLVDYDFIQEQAYHVDRQRNHNRTLHISGVAGGLQVNGGAGYQVTVTAGTAIDQNGRQIVLKADCTLDVRELGLSDTPTAGATGYLHLAYNQMPATDAQADQQGLKGQPRWVEIPCLFWYASPIGAGDSYPPVNNWSNVASYCGTQQGVTGVSENVADWQWEVWTAVGPAPLLLVKLTLDAAGTVSVGDQRSYAGLRLPGPDEMYLRASFASGTAAPGVSFWSSQSGSEPTPRLSVTNDGRVGIGTTVPASSLDVRTDQATLLRLENSVGNGSEVHIDLATYGPGTAPSLDPSSRISAIDDLHFSNHIAFLTKQSGSGTNKLVERLRLTSDGKLGIGTAAPASTLDVRTNQATLLRLENSVGGSGSEVHIDLATYGSGTFPPLDPSARISAIDDQNYSNRIAFLTKQPGNQANKLAERLTISGDGKVGIGTPLPKYPLHIGFLDSQIHLGNDSDKWGEINRWNNRFQILSSEYLTLAIGNTGNDVVSVKSGYLGVTGSITATGSMTANTISIADKNGNVYKENWIGMAPNIGDGKEWLHIGGIIDSDNTRRLALFADQIRAAGDLHVTGKLFVDDEIFWGAPAWSGDDKDGYKYVQINCHDYPGGGSCQNDMCITYTSTTPSDLNLKKDIRCVEQALSKLNQLNGVTFHWNETAISWAGQNVHRYMNAGPQATEAENQALWNHEREEIRNTLAARQIGLIAQDVEKVVPEVVVTDNDGYRRVDYPRLTALLVEAIKELAYEVEVLKAEA